MEVTLPIPITSGGGAEVFYTCGAPTGDGIFKINKANGIIISSTSITVSGFTVKGCNGMAVEPSSGTFYAVVTTNTIVNGSPRRLITLNPDTGVGSDIGSLNPVFIASIAFKSDNSLRGASGFNPPNDQQYFSINKSTASLTFLCAFNVPTGRGAGMVLALNPNDNQIYHYYGELGVDGDFGTIDNESTCARTANLVTGLGLGDELRSLAFSTTDSIFYGGLDNEFISITTSGSGTIINPTAFSGEGGRMKGTAIIGGSSTIPLTPSQQQEVDTFNNAVNIGFTVIGILPVALFFALFSIFSTRLE